MYTPMNSKHFTKHVDASGAHYWVLSTCVAPIQQGFYFVNSGYSDDGRYLWFYCAFPPAEGHCVGVVDFLTDEVRYFPETRGSGWMVDGRTGDLYWACTEGIYVRSPHPQDKARKIADLPKAARIAKPSEAGTHLTFTPDHQEILTDIQTAQGSFIGTFRIQDGSYTLWYRTQRGTPYNHAQICPTNGDLCMCAHEYSYNSLTGQNDPPPLTEDGIYPRLQLIHRDGQREMRIPYANSATHEWWNTNGSAIYYCSSNSIVRDRLGEHTAEVVCHIPIEGGNGTWHAHCTKDEKYFVVDGSYSYEGLSWWRGCPSVVRFWNDTSKRLIPVLTCNPVVEGWTPEHPSIYHIDPHPRFVLDDRLVTFTTTVCGRVDLAVAETAELIELSK